ncbi:RICIN domain-containing protein [Saccharopolyspora endophytica]|uniref:Ricin-type beta-trefoil lectin domain protein n=1 Tax=Saccharopolyspora endophytica TaxID=543886 RepID=A0ABS5DR54_9PSEU|nr:ricin-type beta-trefoil lectin domain protein [Saccharopolyspora endophytica]MBQ0928784.1 ricin-type beta-trefoil lectin domain protein [Saccharopolyspora endophytica]
MGATVLIGYLLNSGPEAPPPAGTDDQLTGSPMEEPVQLRSLESDFCAAVPGDYGLVKQLPCNGAASSAQLWNMAGPDSSTMFARTRNRDTEICLELSGHGSRPHGTEVQVAHCNDSRADNQLWKVERGDRPDTVRIRNAVSDQRCLSPATTKPGSPLVIKDCAGGHGSQWQVIPQHTAP